MMTLYPLVYPRQSIKEDILAVGCDPRAVGIFSQKTDVIPIYIHDIKPAIANIIKQEMISQKGDAVVHRESVSCGVELTDVILLGSFSVLRNFVQKLRAQPYPTLIELTENLDILLNHLQRPITAQTSSHGRTISYDKPLIMGILNTTPDSFYDGGRYTSVENAAKQAEILIAEGADVIDIGGESTRPGADSISAEDEIQRTVPVIQAIRRFSSVPISIDTTKAIVAERAIEAGADMINDISGMTFDTRMPEVMAKTRAIGVMGHVKGTPKDMQQNPIYHHVVRELIEYFAERVESLVRKGVKREHLVIDPCIGFGKTHEHNLTVLRHTSAFCSFGLPVLMGASRKSVIGKVLSHEVSLSPEERLFGTLGAHMYVWQEGAGMVRVHDVKAHDHVRKFLLAMRSKNKTTE